MKIRPKQEIPLNSHQTWIRWKFEDQKINRSKREISQNWTETRKIYFQIFKYFALVTFSLLSKILSRNSCSKSKCFAVHLTVKKNFGQIILLVKNLFGHFLSRFSQRSTYIGQIFFNRKEKFAKRIFLDWKESRAKNFDLKQEFRENIFDKSENVTDMRSFQIKK